MMTRNSRLWHATVAVAAILVAATYIGYAGVNPPTQLRAGRPLKVVILAGQSNMQEPAKWETLAGLADSPETRPLYDKLVDKNGKVRIHKDVRFVKEISGKDEDGNPFTTITGSPLPPGFGGKVLGTELNPKPKKGEKVKRVATNYGPELGFGVTLQKTLGEPILIIKTAWGGKDLHTQFRPPTGEEWTPPKGHPEHPDSAPTPLAIPKNVKLPVDFQPTTVRGNHLQIAKGTPIGAINGVHPIYISQVYDKTRKGEFPANPLQQGDLILGLNGAGLGENPVRQWRATWFGKIRDGDWMLKVTLWRKDKIETVEVDTAQLLPDGRAGIPAFLAEQKAAKKKLVEEGGVYYGKMMQIIKSVLDDPGKHHPAYDPEQGYEIVGFVWFQGFNDMIATTTYPHGDKPRGYERYSWLLAHLIRGVRKELKSPKMPFVIGVFGQGGEVDKPVPFREGMAAPASYDEFKGTVAAVRTAPFWDCRIDEIQGKLDRVMQYRGSDPSHQYAKLQAEIRAYREKMGNPDTLTGKERGRLERKIKAGIIEIVRTPEETEYLRNNVSNQGYHYHGSPKFFVRAGAAFADALSDMIRGR